MIPYVRSFQSFHLTYLLKSILAVTAISGEMYHTSSVILSHIYVLQYDHQEVVTLLSDRSSHRYSSIFFGLYIISDTQSVLIIMITLMDLELTPV